MISRTPRKPKPSRPAEPTRADLQAQLGRSWTVWDELLAAIESTQAPISHEWHYTAKTATWHLRLKRGARTIVYLLPREKSFQTAFVFGERAVTEILSGSFPASIHSAIRDARPYAEGRGIRLLTRNRRDIATLLKLIAVKLAN